MTFDTTERETALDDFLFDFDSAPETFNDVRTILHLCADTGSDTWSYRGDPRYEVITIGEDIGVENYTPDRPIWGVFANPVCTMFSPVRRGKPGENYPHVSDPEQGMFLVRECQRIIAEAQPQWWVIENPAMGTLRNYLGRPTMTYQPWQYGSPWTKATALWGRFNQPTRIYNRWENVPNKLDLWSRRGRKPSLAYLHKSAFNLIPEFRDSGMPAPETDAELRSLCSQGFARAFKTANP